MKKGDTVLVKFDKLDKLNTTLGYPIEDNFQLNKTIPIKVKNVIPGKTGLVQISKKKRNKIEGRLVEYINLELPNCNKIKCI